MIRLKLYGVFRSAGKAAELNVDLPDGATNVREAISYITSQNQFGPLRGLIFESGSSDPRPNALILVSGREVNTMEGLQTELKEGDELVLLPIAHGG